MGQLQARRLGGASSSLSASRALSLAASLGAGYGASLAASAYMGGASLSSLAAKLSASQHGTAQLGPGAGASLALPSPGGSRAGTHRPTCT